MFKAKLQEIFIKSTLKIVKTLVAMSNSAWQKTAAASLLAYFGLSYLDEKYIILDELKNGLKFKNAIKFTRDMAGKHYTVTDNWYKTLSRVDARKPALVDAVTAQSFSFYDVEQMSNQVANWAIARRFAVGETVGLFMENRAMYIITWLGLTKAGVTVALINSNNKKKPLLHSIEIANCVALIFGSELTDPVEGVLSELHAAGITLYCNPVENQCCPNFAANMYLEVITGQFSHL